MASFEDFVTSRGHALLRFAYLVTGDRHLAEDLTQEALMRAHRRWSRIENVEGPEPYVRKAILRHYLSWRRRRSSSEMTLSHFPDRPYHPETAERTADREEMWSLLRTLPRRQRAVLVLRYYEDMSDTDIAESLGCSPVTVRAHAFKALGKLRKSLSPESTRKEKVHG